MVELEKGHTDKKTELFQILCKICIENQYKYFVWIFNIDEVINLCHPI